MGSTGVRAVGPGRHQRDPRGLCVVAGGLPIFTSTEVAQGCDVKTRGALALGDFEGVIDLNAEIAHCALDSWNGRAKAVTRAGWVTQSCSRKNSPLAPSALHSTGTPQSRSNRSPARVPPRRGHLGFWRLCRRRSEQGV